MRTVILASVLTYARRYVAAFVAVLTATGFIVAINGLSSAARTGAVEAVSRQYVGADLAAPNVGDSRAHAAAVRRLQHDPAVTSSAVNWEAYSGLAFPDGTQNVSIGSVAAAPGLRWQRTASGRLPRTVGEVAVSRDDAAEHHVAIGDVLPLRVGRASRTVVVTGLVDDSDGPLTATAYLPEVAFATLGRIGIPTDVVLRIDGDPTATARRLSADAGTQVITATAYERQLRLTATQGVDIFQKLILVFAGISLFVGALVIANTFAILLAHRSHDLALMRCVGATRAQIARSVVTEGLVIGAAGSFLGAGLGYAVARIGVTVTRHLSPSTPMASPTLSPSAVAVPVLLGVLVTAVASYLPARRASAASPLAALQPQDAVERGTRAGTLRLISAGLLLSVGLAGLLAGLAGSLPVGMVGGMLSFVGVLVLTPLIVPAAIRLVGPVTRRAGLASRLAHANSLRNPRRTAATSTALLIGVTLITSVVVGAASISHKVTTSLDTKHPIDLLVGSEHGSIPERVTARIARLDGVSAVTLPGTSARIGTRPVEVLGVDRSALAVSHDPTWRIRRDQIVLPSGAFDDLVEGARVTLHAGGHQRELTVTYASGTGDSALVSRQTLDDMGARSVPRVVWVRADEDADARAVVAGVTGIASSAGLDLTGGLPDRVEILAILDVVLAVTVGLLAIAVLIALVGVGNTLSLSVLERIRENSLLRALGLERSGLRRMVAVEALLMAGVSAVLGIALGSAYAWFGVRTVSTGVFSASPDLTIPWARVSLIFLVAAGAGLVACVLPARRAARIAPAAGLVAE